MQKELKLWQFVLEELRRNKSIILLIVAKSSGSSPGREGFKMAVAEDELFGSIGGGVMEVSLVEEARDFLKEGNGSFAKTQVHKKNSSDASGMICSGEQTVVFFKLMQEHLELVREIPSTLNQTSSKHLSITSNELSLLEDPKNETNFSFERKDEADFVYTEKLFDRESKLFIIGGGHCGLALSDLMSKMDFHITLFDDRPELNTIAKNEFADEKIILNSYDQIAEPIPSGENHYVVVMTLGYKFDEIVIRNLFDKDFKYFGVLGSKAKMATLLKDLRKDGFDKDRLEKIHTPIGFEINSRTPEEIAVSIAAEIIAVKNSKG